MAESTKLRLVRCPNCQTLLTELPDYSVYQCGVCDAVLRANKCNLEGDNGSQRSDVERIAVVSDKSDNFSDKSEKFPEKMTVSGVENGGDSVKVSKVINETIAQRFEQYSKGNVDKWALKNENFCKNELGSGNVHSKVDKWALERGNSCKTELVNGNMHSKVDKFETHVENGNGSRRSGRVFERKLSDRGDEERFRRTRRGYFEEMRSASSNHMGERTSKYHFDSSFRNDATRSARTKYEEPNREELLRKLDELNDQLRRIHNVDDKFRDRVPLESEDCFRDRPCSFQRVSRQFSAPNKHVIGTPYFEHCHEPYNYHNSIHCSSHVPRYEDSFESQMLSRPPPRRILGHPQHVCHGLDHFEPNPYNTTLNQLSRSCYRCYDGQEQIPSSAFGNKRFPHGLHGAFGSHSYTSRMVNTPPMGSCDPIPRTRWPNDLNLEAGPSARTRPQRVVLASGDRCPPIANGAPFVTCRNCFELLKLPKKVVCKKGEWKMSCGACSSEISFTIVDGKLSPIDTIAKQKAIETLESSNEVGHGHVKRDNTSSCSEDYTNSVYDFQAMDKELLSSSTCHGLSSNKSEEMPDHDQVYATTSEDENFSDDLVSRQGVTSMAEPPVEHPFDYTSKCHSVDQCSEGNSNSCSEQDRVMTNKGTVRHTSLKESLATEMEISPNDYADNGVLQETVDVCREDDQPKAKRGVDSFLAGIIKKSFKDFSKSNQILESGKRIVTVNGHLTPDRLVKKAEKLAGPIYPGQYWYDFRAGFWGVMGGPCLGIIPPYIEEFKYPMAENCAGGKTSVFVNGRELHKKDLDLLATRGLPGGRDRSYLIEISGRVVDEESGEELDSLGKLAPTVEKVNHGFGMRVPS